MLSSPTKNELKFIDYGSEIVATDVHILQEENTYFEWLNQCIFLKEEDKNLSVPSPPKRQWLHQCMGPI